MPNPFVKKIDLRDTTKLINFSSEVLVRLAFFNANGSKTHKQRMKNAHKILNKLNKELHKMLNSSADRLRTEYDKPGANVRPPDSPDNSTQ